MGLFFFEKWIRSGCKLYMFVYFLKENKDGFIYNVNV